MKGNAMKLIILLGAAVLLASGVPALADGKAVYTKKCASCHGPDGSGNTKMGKKLKCRDLTDAAVQAKLTDAAIAKAIKEGVSEDGKVRMKPVEGLSDAEISEVTAYVRTLKK
jgi:mono/diheme cytochrome c family protein